MKQTPKRLGLILLCLIIGGYLRVWRIGSQSLWFDEVFSRNVAVGSDILSIVRDGVAGDVHPPLYFASLNLWVALTGDSDVALRMFGALTALLALPAFYHLAKLMFGERAGLIALALAAISPLQVYYAQEARQYALSITLAAWAAVGLIRLIHGKRYGWPLYVLAGVGALYTHYFMGILLAVIHFWLLTQRPARGQWRAWLTADIAIALLFIPQLVLFLRQTQAVLSDFWILPHNAGALITTPFFLLFGLTLPLGIREITEVLVMLLLAVITVDIIRFAPRQARAYWLLCMISVFGTLVVTLIYSAIRSPIYLERSFVLLTPFLLAAIAGGAAYTRRPSPARLLLGLIGLLMIFGTVYHALTIDANKPPYRQIAADLMANPDALTTPVLHLYDATYLPLQYYAPALNQQLGDLVERSWLFPKTWQIFGVKRQSQEELNAWLLNFRGRLRVVVFAAVEMPGQLILDQLLQRACSVQKKAYQPNVDIYDLYIGPCLTRLYVP